MALPPPPLLMNWWHLHVAFCRTQRQFADDVTHFNSTNPTGNEAAAFTVSMANLWFHLCTSPLRGQPEVETLLFNVYTMMLRAACRAGIDLS